MPHGYFLYIDYTYIIACALSYQVCNIRVTMSCIGPKVDFLSGSRAIRNCHVCAILKERPRNTFRERKRESEGLFHSETGRVLPIFIFRVSRGRRGPSSSCLPTSGIGSSSIVNPNSRVRDFPSMSWFKDARRNVRKTFGKYGLSGRN